MSLIANKKELGFSKERANILEMIEAGLQSVDPKNLLKNSIKYNVNFNSLEIQNKIYDILGGRIFVVGAGKASGKLAEALEEIMGGDNIKAGVVNTSGGKYKTEKIKINRAGHPLPDKRGVKGVIEMLSLKEEYQISEKDLVICLLSGGASAMLVHPGVGIVLEDKQKTTQLLIESGADINEINSVRKHISQIKGGQLAEFFQPAQVATIIISDVVGNDPAVIGSGPTVEDPSTYQDALNVIMKYNLQDKLSSSVISHIQKGVMGMVPETPKKLFNTKNYVLGKNSIALEAMAFTAKNMGLKPMIVSTEMIGKSIEAAEVIAGDIIGDEYEKFNCLFYGGETTIALPEKHGKGGRNLHLSALMTLALKDYEPEWVFASISSDGRDFVSGVAGAIVDSNTIKTPEYVRQDYKKFIREFDVFSLFKKTKLNLLETGDTGTNVGDLVVLIRK